MINGYLIDDTFNFVSVLDQKKSVRPTVGSKIRSSCEVVVLKSDNPELTRRVQKRRRVRAGGANRVPGPEPAFLLMHLFTTFLRSTQIIHEKFDMCGTWIFLITMRSTP